MHFLFVPVIEDKKWNAKNPDKPPRVKVCAKELIDKIEMSVFHPELQKFLDTHSEKNLYPVLNGTTIGGNRTIAELKQSACSLPVRAKKSLDMAPRINCFRKGYDK